MSSNVKKMALLSESCPSCGTNSSLREILYGLPYGPPDPKIYVLGGCCVEEGDPEVACGNCGWEGSFGEVE